MEKICEFCRALRPVVYCKADAAHLCLSCDARVHSANALSSKHIRTLLCERCKYHPAHVRCFDHRMFICRGCDRILHEDASHHQKQKLTSYMGSPSPKDFAALWGFDLNEPDNSALQGQFASTSYGSVDGSRINLDIPSQPFLPAEQSFMESKLEPTTSVFGAETEFGSSSLQSKIYHESQYQQTPIILQQILDLNRLQLTELKNNPSMLRCEEQAESSSSRYDTLQKLDGNCDQFSQNLHNIGTYQKFDSQQEESFPSPFSQLEQLTASSTAGIPLQGDPFWQCKSPIRSSQLWSQNMQDLGVCEELVCFDDFNMPDVDLTFPNYEELFGGDHDLKRALLNDKYYTFSSTSFDRSDDGSPRPSEGGSVASSVHITSSAHVDRDIGLSDQAHHVLGSVDSPHFIQPSYPALSFSFSKLSAESHGTDCLDNGVYPTIAGGEPPCDSPDTGTAHSEARESAMMRYKEKKKVRMNEKKNRYSSQKARAGVCKRVKGRSMKTEGCESDTM